MKISLATLLLFIFSIHAFPVQEYGKLLFKKALTEEVNDAAYSGDDTIPADYYNCNRNDTQYSKWVLLKKMDTALTPTKAYTKQYIPDTPTQPPNCALVTTIV